MVFPSFQLPSQIATPLETDPPLELGPQWMRVKPVAGGWVVCCLMNCRNTYCCGLKNGSEYAMKNKKGVDAIDSASMGTGLFRD